MLPTVDRSFRMILENQSNLRPIRRKVQHPLRYRNEPWNSSFLSHGISIWQDQSTRSKTNYGSHRVYSLFDPVSNTAQTWSPLLWTSDLGYVLGHYWHPLVMLKRFVASLKRTEYSKDAVKDIVLVWPGVKMSFQSRWLYTAKLRWHSISREGTKATNSYHYL